MDGHLWKSRKPMQRKQKAKAPEFQNRFWVPLQNREKMHRKSKKKENREGRCNENQKYYTYKCMQLRS